MDTCRAYQPRCSLMTTSASPDDGHNIRQVQDDGGTRGFADDDLAQKDVTLDVDAKTLDPATMTCPVSRRDDDAMSGAERLHQLSVRVFLHVPLPGAVAAHAGGVETDPVTRGGGCSRPCKDRARPARRLDQQSLLCTPPLFVGRRTTRERSTARSRIPRNAPAPSASRSEKEPVQRGTGHEPADVRPPGDPSDLRGTEQRHSAAEQLGKEPDEQEMNCRGQPLPDRTGM